MKLNIKDYCIRCGLCEDLYPELFYLDTKLDKVCIKYEEIPDHMKDQAKNAIRDCAVTAIFAEKQ